MYKKKTEAVKEDTKRGFSSFQVPVMKSKPTRSNLLKEKNFTKLHI